VSLLSSCDDWIKHNNEYTYILELRFLTGIGTNAKQYQLLVPACFWLVWFVGTKGAPVFPVMYVAQLKYGLMFLGSVTCVQLKGANNIYILAS
jgi:hypothetical protein